MHWVYLIQFNRRYLLQKLRDQVVLKHKNLPQQQVSLINFESVDKPKRTRKKKPESPPVPITRSSRRRQVSSEAIETRATPARKAKSKLDTAEPPSTISKRKTKKKEETPMRTIVTRRMARNQ
jgi:hypothetical protein